mmetsp:Transcript_7941/g.20449  ORF Transcript_7941/g.20449 Transcript_7941/m.20449 type:complete len:135 (-) Transcript_7941:27-431(-)
MATKRSNPFCGHLEPVMRRAHSEVVQPANSLQTLMAGVRLASRGIEERSQSGGLNFAGKSTATASAPCSHCCRVEQEANLIQCHRCFDVFCTRACSTPNFDSPEDRMFCLECNQAERAEAAAAAQVPQAHGMRF